jgi:hypothetical protein
MKMYLAELRGKLSDNIKKKEDILTSNVFSFFKYSARDVFLKGYLRKLGFDVSDQQSREAKFTFWPRFEDKTEPDLVLIVGDYYLLIEAKYFSGFAAETQKTKAQLLREIDGGRREAKNNGKQFYLIAIAKDSYQREEQWKTIPPDLSSFCRWTNWQKVSWFLYDILDSNVPIRQEDRDFALDLYTLLDSKNLRGFQSFEGVSGNHMSLKTYTSIFFDARTAKFRGDFVGFPDSLQLDGRIGPLKASLFFKSGRRLWEYQLHQKKLKHIGTTIFYEEG